MINRLLVEHCKIIGEPARNCSSKERRLLTVQLQVKAFCRGLAGQLSLDFEDPHSKHWGQGSWKHILNRLDKPGIQVDSVTYASLLQCCVKQNALFDGKRIHCHIVKNELVESDLLSSHLLKMYASCGALEDALALFANLNEPNVILWNVIIGAHLRQGQGKDALKLLNQMKREGVMPTKVSFVCILSACAKHMDLVEAKQIHSCIFANGYDTDIVAGTALVNMYGKCGGLDNAMKAFERISKRDLFLWNTMISVYVQYGLCKKAFHLFEQMRWESIMPNEVTFVGILAACTSEAAIVEGKRMHIYILNHRFQPDVILGTALVNMYGKCGNVEDARKVFDQLPKQDVILWTAMIALYSQHGQSKEAFHLFDLMQSKGIMANNVTFVNILTACSSQTMLALGEQVHVCILLSNLELEVNLGNALVTMYGKCGSLEDAQMMFDNMPERDLVTWNALMGLYSQQGHDKEVFQLLNEMQLEGLLPDRITLVNIITICTSKTLLFEGKWMHTCIGERGLKSDVFVGNALIYMYGKCGSVEDAQKVFNELAERDVVTWNAIISAYMQDGKGKEALSLFNQMQRKGVSPNSITFVSILDACASQADLSQGKQMHNDILYSGFELDIVVATALVNMYSKCGSLEDSQKVYDEFTQEDIVLWNSIITAYAQHGQVKKALQVLRHMQKQAQPNEVTYVNILVACSHSGLIDEGHGCFASMNPDHGLAPGLDHYVCMVDLLGRAGQLDEAEYLIHNMPFQPTGVLLMALLGACRYNTDVERAESAANRVFQLDPERATPYIILSNIYAAAGREEDAALVGMKAMELEHHGCCSVEGEGAECKFSVEISAYSQCSDIHLCTELNPGDGTST